MNLLKIYEIVKIEEFKEKVGENKLVLLGKQNSEYSDITEIIYGG